LASKFTQDQFKKMQVNLDVYDDKRKIFIDEKNLHFFKNIYPKKTYFKEEDLADGSN
jgi:hypothetical protein